MTDDEARIAFACADCGFDTDTGEEYYFVKRDCWLKHARDVKDRMLCIGCLERRAGRNMARTDFSSGFLAWVEVGGRRGKLSISDRLRARIAEVTTQEPPR